MNTSKPVVLVAPLDWGLGHTMRCIPIIKQLLADGAEVLVACNSKQKQQLVQEFSSLRYIDLQGYNIYYAKSRLLTVVSILFQVRKILRSIKQERLWLSKFIRENRVDAIISDNRYGLAADQIPCVFITHQLQVLSGLGVLVDNLIQKRLYRYINKFTACWVPDWKSTDLSTAGVLSHPRKFPGIPVHFIGCLSRLNACDEQRQTTGLLIILSGPEPQRTVLENIMLRELKHFNGTGVLIRGVVDHGPVASFNKITIINYAPSGVLNGLICDAEAIICRSGYTSLMDILKLGKKAILIPTPGQGEQEYLAMRLHQQKRAIMASQDNFRLSTVLDLLESEGIETTSGSMDEYKKVVDDFCESLKSRVDS